jgi:predicted Zn-dependent protease
LKAKSTLVKIALLAQLMLLLSVGTAYAHYLVESANSVNDSGEIRWKDATRYDSARAFAIKQWNALERVPILRDTPDTPTDLVFRDFRDCGTGVIGYWQPRDGADSINFNACSMGKQSEPVRRATATHELGHALRLAHPSGSKQSDYWRKHSIMYYCSSCVPFTKPQAHDRSDYRDIW